MTYKGSLQPRNRIGTARCTDSLTRVGTRKEYLYNLEGMGYSEIPVEIQRLADILNNGGVLEDSLKIKPMNFPREGIVRFEIMNADRCDGWFEVDFDHQEMSEHHYFRKLKKIDKAYFSSTVGNFRELEQFLHWLEPGYKDPWEGLRENRMTWYGQHHWLRLAGENVLQSDVFSEPLNN